MMEAVAEGQIKKYPAYKNTGMDWLGDVPEHWGLLPFGAIAELTSISNQQHLNLLSVYLDRGVIQFKDAAEKRTNATSEDLSKYQLVEPGNLVLNNQQAWRGSVGVSSYKGIVSPAYLVLKFKIQLDHRFSNYLFRDKSIIPYYLINSKGVGTIQRNLYWPQLKRSRVPIPPLPEQTAIASFLDRKCALIDKAIAIKEKQIALLKERRQILIQNAVTRGLNPNVKMKDSGVEWLGDLPEHWTLPPNKFIFNLKKELVGKQHSHFKLLSLTLNGIIERDMENPQGKFPAEFDAYQKVAKGDFVFCLFDVEETPRTVGLSDFDGMITGAYTVFSLNKVVNPKYLYYFYLNIDNDKRFRSLYKGLRNTIPKETFMAFKTFIPPLAEQIAIADYLDNQSAIVEKAIALQEHQIEKLKEYKTCLINEAVTGKIKVC
jgi:type I restriction enzyme S subunit